MRAWVFARHGVGFAGIGERIRDGLMAELEGRAMRFRGRNMGKTAAMAAAQKLGKALMRDLVLGLPSHYVMHHFAPVATRQSHPGLSIWSEQRGGAS